jgi:hypothetical protein
MFRFEGPKGGEVYTFDAYQGCDYCNTPIGIVISRLKGDMLEYADHVSHGQLPFHFFGDGENSDLGDFALPMIDPDTLTADIVGEVGDLSVTMDGYELTLTELFEGDELRRAVEKNMARTMGQWMKERGVSVDLGASDEEVKG